MRPLARAALLTLLALPMTACGYWQIHSGDVRDALGDPDVRHVRITESNGRQTEARLVEIRGDTIFGTRGSSTPTSCETAGATCTLQMPIQRVGFVESRHFSAVKTVAMFVVPLGAFLVVFAR